jgi:dipeptidyl aminopeptidase/acylaminoacyl peptidase
MKILGLKSVLVGAVLGAVWASLCAVGVANGQAGGPVTGKRPMTFANLMAMKRVSDPQISPSGKWVMFSVTDVSLEKNAKINHLWVVALSAGSSGGTNAGILRSAQNDKQSGERQVTFGDGESFGRFSPDGKSVSFSLKDQIYLAPWDEAAGKVGTAVQVTNVAGGADGAIWSPDSKRLMFVADVYPECSVKGGDRAKATATTSTNAGILRSAQNDNRGGGEIAGAQPATWAEEDACDKAKDDAAEKSPVKGQVWDALLYRHWDQYTGLKRSHILVVDFVGNVRDLTPRSAVGDAETPTWFLGAPLQYAWAPDSKEIAYVTNLDKVPAASTNNDVFTLRLDEPGAKAVKVSTSPGSDDEPEYSPDGKWLAFRSQKQAGFESDRFRLMLYDREKKTIKELLPKFDYWVDEYTWTPESEGIFYVYGKAGGENVDYIAVMDNGSAGIQLGFLQAEGEFSDVHVLPGAGLLDDGTILVATRMTAEGPSEIIKLPKIKKPRTSEWGGEEAITHVNDALIAQLDLPKMESFWFSGAEGTKVEGFLLKPPGFDAAKKYPVKFVMHGGPQTALGDSWSYRWNWELLAADGYVVVGINRRGSTGYGQKFVDEVSGDWGGRAYEDLMKGLDYAEATYPFLDKTRECALGASYGGFMADWVLTHTNRFQCIVTHDGMVNPVSAYGTTEEMWFNEWEFRRPEDFPKGWDGFSASYDPMGHPNPTSQSRDVGHPAEPWRYQNLPADQDPFRKWSPMRYIENAKTPTLIIHSQKDYRLDVSQGFELYTALERRGVPARFLYFPDEGHWVLKPQNSQLWYETVADWCDRWTKSGKYAEK